MYSNPKMVKQFLVNLSGEQSTLQKAEKIPNTSNETEFSLEELDDILFSKLESAPGLNDIIYGMMKNFSLTGEGIFLDLVNQVWMSQDISGIVKHILMVIIPKPGRDTSC